MGKCVSESDDLSSEILFVHDTMDAILNQMKTKLTKMLTPSVLMRNFSSSPRTSLFDKNALFIPIVSLTTACSKKIFY